MPATLALRLQFLIEAARLDLLSPALHRAVLSLTAGGRNRVGLMGPLEAVRDGFLGDREQLGSLELDWGLVGELEVVSALDIALTRSRGEVSPRASAERLGQVCESGTRLERKGKGSFYTPRWVADLVARTALRGLLDGRRQKPEAALSLRILDPAAGAGAFLAAMVEAIAEAMGEEESENVVRRAAALECVRGFELDPVAAEAGRLALWLVSSRPGRPAAVPADALLVRDALREPTERGSFDAVVGNPPWGVRPTSEQTARLSGLAPAALRGRHDSFLFFLAAAADAVREDGVVAMVLPDALLSHLKYEGMREHLLASFGPLHIARFGDGLFPGATAPACALCVIGNSIAPRSFLISDIRDRQSAPHGVSWRAPCEAVSATPHHSFLLPPPELDWLVNELRARRRTLGELGDAFRFHDSGINYATADLGRDLLYTGVREDLDDIPVTRGRDFAALALPGRSAWLRHDWRSRIPPAAEVSVRTDLYRTAPKLLLRQTGDRPIATVDRTGVHFGRSVIAITGPSERDLLWLAAVMNSSVFAALYRALTSEAGRPFAQVKVGKLKLVPVPPVDADAGLAELARRLLSETDEERRRELLSQLDDRVAEAYGLNADDGQRVMAFVGPRSVSRAGRRRRAGTS